MRNSQLTVLFFLLFAAVNIVHAETFRESVLADKVEPNQRDTDGFTQALAGTWAANFEVKYPTAQYVDFISADFALLSTELTNLKSTASRMKTMLMAWRVLELKRVPIDANTLAQFDAVKIENARIDATKDANGKWVKRPSNVAAYLILGRDGSRLFVEEAVANGVKEMWAAKISVGAPKASGNELDTSKAMTDWEGVDVGYTYVVLAGNRMLIGSIPDRSPQQSPFVRRSILDSAQVKSFEEQRQLRLKREYGEWQSRCTSFRSASVDQHSLDECRRWRDSYLKLGLVEVTERPLDREIASPKLANTEKNFLTSFDQATLDSHQPYLDYCAVYRTVPQQQTVLKRLYTRNYERTAWRLTATTQYVEAPIGWSKQEYQDYQSLLLAWQRSLWLREDGVVGVNGVFETANRWQVDGDTLSLHFDDGRFKLTAAIGNNLPIIDNKSPPHAAVYNLELIRSNFEFYQERALDPRHPNRDQIVAELQTMICPPIENSSIATSIDGPDTIKKKEDSLSTKSIDIAKTDVKIAEVIQKTTAKAVEMPVYSHIRIEPSRPDVPIDPAIRSFWDKGVYAYLRDDGKLGFNTDDPGPYFYLGDNTWTRDADKLTINLDGMIYSVDLGKQAGTTLSAQERNSNNFKIYLKPKNAGQR